MEHYKNSLVTPALADTTENICEKSQINSPECGISNKRINNQLELLNSHKILIKNKAISQRKTLLHSKLSQSREQIEKSQENEQNIFILFPEEIWMMILQNIPDWRDLTNCAIASPILENILMPTKVEWLFGKVFPIITNYIDFYEILELRLVCKLWCSAVDNNLEEINQTLKKTECEGKLEYLRVGGDPLDCNHIFWVPVIYDDSENRDNLKRHPRNPFISRSMTVEATSPSFSTELPIFLSDFGQHIFHLSLTTAINFKYSNFYQCYTSCVQSLSKCPLIRSLSISGEVEKSECEFPPEIDPLPDHQYLESVSVDMGYPCVPQFQDELIKKYSGQLKKLSVHLWNSFSYHNLCWENLRELEVKQVVTDGVLNSLMKISAPLVQKLTVTVGQLNLEKLIGLIKQFANLENLKLSFSKEFTGFLDREILEVKFESFPMCTAIRTIQLDTSCLEYGLSYNFLILFPFLKKIYLRVDAGKEKIKLKNPAYYPESDLLQISKLIWDDKDRRSLYKSDLWSEIDSLSNLEICRVNTGSASDEDSTFETFELYSREGYNRRKCDPQNLLKYHLKCLESEAERQRQSRGNGLREEFDAFEICEPLKTKDANDVFPEKIWKIILKNLPDDDILNCSKSSKFLAEILEETKAEWVFDKSFPILFNYLDKVDILKCRAICKKWCNGVDKYLEDLLTVENPKTISNKPFTGQWNEPNKSNFKYNFYFPRDSDFEYYHNKVENSLKLHPRNPFVGRAVNLIFSSDEQQLTEIQEFVESFGSHIWHFNVVGESESENKKYIRLNQEIYFGIVHKILTTCPNIRSLSISNLHMHWPWYDDTGFFFPHEVPDLKYFKSFHMIGHNKRARILEGMILRRYGSQMRSINTSVWGDELWTDLDNLRELFIFQRDSNMWIDYLIELEAPNVQELYLRLDGKEPLLTKLIAAANNFPNIHKLKLELCENFGGFTQKEIVNHSFGFFSPAGLTNLEIVTGRSYSFSFDFFIFFPYLKRLKILHDFSKNEEISGKKRENDSDSSSDESMVMVLKAEEDLKKNEDEDTQNCTTDIPCIRFIDLPTPFWNQSGEMSDPEMIEKIWKSNIWQIFRSLEFLEIKNKTEGGTGSSLTFRRPKNVLNNSI